MIIEISRIPAGGKRFTGDEPPSVLEVEDGGDLRVDGPLVYDLKAELAGSELLVRGTLSVDVSFRRSRCAAFFPSAVKEPKFFYSHDVVDRRASIDLTPEMRESILVAFPAYPVCGPACKGLCPQCGADLNKGACGCKAPAVHTWGALDKLKLGKGRPRRRPKDGNAS